MKKYIFLLLGIVILCSQSNELVNKSKENIGLQGYDPVAYFTKNDAVKGSKAFSHVYNGVTYYFISEKYRKLFIKNPDNYLPQFGGWCAYGCSGTKELTGFVADRFAVDPKTFKIVNNKLYLFYNNGSYNALEKWNSFNENIMLNNAETYWGTLEKLYKDEK